MGRLERRENADSVGGTGRSPMPLYSIVWRARPVVGRLAFPGQSSTAAPTADQFWSPWPAPPPANKEGFQDTFLVYSHDSNPSQPTFYISFKKLKKFKKERHT